MTFLGKRTEKLFLATIWSASDIPLSLRLLCVGFGLEWESPSTIKLISAAEMSKVFIALIASRIVSLSKAFCGITTRTNALLF
jgi:hypothetical protein